MKIGSLFAGIGGFDLAARWMGWETAWFSEIDPYASAVLAKHWPGVPNLGDITKIQWQASHTVDLLCGGFPCQDLSVANYRGRGLDGEQSGLWSEFARAIRELRPTWVVIENVPQLLRRGFDVVRGDLRTLGYRVSRPVRMSASALGAPHLRERLWIVAHTDGKQLRLQPRRREGIGFDSLQPGINVPPRDASYSNGLRQLESQGSLADERGWPSDRHGWDAEPGVSGVDDGLPSRMERERCLGNAIVPQCALVIFQAIQAAEAKVRVA